MIAWQEARQHGLLLSRHWPANIISGVIVGLVALPLAMAFAIASGVKPEQGIYTAIVAGLTVSVFGGSRLQIAGPTGAFIAILANITIEHGVDGLLLSSLMAGVILIAMGLARMGALIKFIPSPVIVGFTAGIGVIIWVSQWKDFFGLNPVTGKHFHDKLVLLLLDLPHFHHGTTSIGCLALLVLLLSPRIPGIRRVPGPLLAMLLCTVTQQVLQLPGVATIGSAFGGIPQQLPRLGLPPVDADRLIDLMGPAFAIAMLGAIESLLSAVVADGMAGTKHDSNQELIGQGLANLLCPIFGGFAATGAIARTATNIRNGGTSPLSGVVHSLTLLGIILFLAPLAEYIPLTSLAAILFVVAWNMSDTHHFASMLRKAPKADIAILLTTFTLTVLVDLILAVQIGVLLASLDFLRRMATVFETEQVIVEDLEQELQREGIQHLPAGVLVYAIQGPFFFAAVENFERALGNIHQDPKILILRLKWVPFIDITGLQTLETVLKDLHKRNVRVLLSGANDAVLAKLEKAGLIDLVGQVNSFRHFREAIVAASRWATGETQ
ncbi:STAS domain-containing protein [bacterium]|nr:STAS domain-containing protein [bacterium]